MSDREKHLANIRRHAEKMRTIADGYEQLEKMAAKEGSSEQMLSLVDTAGEVVCHGLGQYGNLLECLVHGLAD